MVILREEQTTSRAPLLDEQNYIVFPYSTNSSYESVLNIFYT